MILQALYDLAQREDLVADPDYEPKPVAWLVPVSTAGTALPFVPTHTPPPTERKGKPRPKSFPVPRQPVRTSGDLAFFLVDKAEYVFGLDPAGKRTEKKLQTRAALFREQVEACAEATGDEGVQAVAEMLRSVAEGRQEVTLPEDCAPNDLFAFVYEPDVDLLVTDRPAVKDYWRSVRERDEGEEARCLITGEPCTPGSLHVQLKRLPGATSSGVPLVSFNSSAFESYGWSGNENAPVSRVAAEAYGTALNRLLHPAWPDPRNPGTALPRRNFLLGEDTLVCFWASEACGEDFLGALRGLLEADPDVVADVYRSIWQGRPAPELPPSTFYALTLSGAQGRAIVRDWFESTLDRVQRNLSRHFSDLDLVRNTPRPKRGDLPPQIPLRSMLRSLAVRGDERRLPRNLASQIVRSALEDSLYPLALLQRAIERTRSEMGRKDWADLERRDARARWIKAVLNRRRRRLPDARFRYQEVTRAMDPTNTNPGYVLGRLIAVIERIQEEALGQVNATVVDRYFSGASAAPRSVFVRLDKNALHHVRKLRDDTPGKARFYKSLLDDLHEPFEAKAGGYPAHLSLEDQGLFILGYHQMRHWLWMTKEERNAWRAEQAPGIEVAPETEELASEDAGDTP